MLRLTRSSRLEVEALSSFKRLQNTNHNNPGTEGQQICSRKWKLGWDSCLGGAGMGFPERMDCWEGPRSSLGQGEVGMDGV